MSNQHIRGKADQLPEDEQHDKVVRQDDAEHGKHEKRKSGEVTGFAFVIAHIAERIDMDECSNAADEDKHRLAQLIQGKTERDLENPRNVDPVWLGCRDVRLEKNPAATDKAYQHGRVRNNTAQRFRSAEQHCNRNRRSERREQGVPWDQAVHVD